MKVASGKLKRKHCGKRISQERKEKENSKKSRPFQKMPQRRAPVFLSLHEGRLCRDVEFIICHVVAYRPIRHFSPVNYQGGLPVRRMRKVIFQGNFQNMLAFCFTESSKYHLRLVIRLRKGVHHLLSLLGSSVEE